jgi:hypothetical protein
VSITLDESSLMIEKLVEIAQITSGDLFSLPSVSIMVRQLGLAPF